jgi:hypothetical protein
LLAADVHPPYVQTENRLSHPNPAPESLPAPHRQHAPLNSLNYFPGPFPAARMSGLRG